MDELTDELVALAVELINEFGAELQYELIVKGDYNPATSKADIVSNIVQPVKGLVEDYSLQNSGQGFASGMIKEGDKKFSLAGGDITPSVGGMLLFNGTRYTIANLKSYYLGNTPVLHECQGR